MSKHNLKDVIRKSSFARRQRPSVGRQNEIMRPSTTGTLGQAQRLVCRGHSTTICLKGPKPLIVSRLTSIKRYLMNKTFLLCRDQPQTVSKTFLRIEFFVFLSYRIFRSRDLCQTMLIALIRRITTIETNCFSTLT